MKCKYCEYQWDSIKENPKACPRCKNRTDRSPSPLKYGKDIGVLLGEPMTSKRFQDATKYMKYFFKGAIDGVEYKITPGEFLLMLEKRNKQS